MPGIFIGIGGIGGSIVAQVRRALNLRIAQAGDSPTANAAASQFRFLLVDTWKDGATLGFKAVECFELPTGKNKFDTDNMVTQWFRGDDAFLPEWWPVHKGMPLKVGAFNSGAGQLRIKGKLAYRVSLTDAAPQVADGVKQELSKIDAVLGPATGVHTVPVYIVCSLGGGTGSGMALTLAQHLRQTLPRHCQIIGVFPLASITQMGPGGADTASIWANTDAALREIDYFQRTAGTHENQINPFFQWPGAGNILYGTERPFEYCYLFTQENSQGLSLGTFSEYNQLIAETLVAESFSDLIDEGLKAGISGPHSQFSMQLNARQLLAERPTTYASAAVGSLIYPADRIERHLARHFGISVLERMMQVDAALSSVRAGEFLEAQELSAADLQATLMADIPVPDGLDRAIPRLPKSLLDVEQDQEYAKANRDKSLASVDRARLRLDEHLDKGYQAHLVERRRIVFDAYAGPNGALSKLVSDTLNASGASALGLASDIVKHIERRLDNEWADLNLQIEGNSNAIDDQPGRKRALQGQDGSWDDARHILGRGFNTGLLGVANRNGKEAKAKFRKTIWLPLLEDSEALKRAIEARTLLADLRNETNRMANLLGSLVQQTALLRNKLQQSITTDLGAKGVAGVLDLAVMDEPIIVDHHFGSVLQQAKAEGVGACAGFVTALPGTQEDAETDATVPTLGDAGIVAETFHRLLNQPSIAALANDTYRDRLERAIVANGTERISGDVQELSIWDALVAECQVRLERNLPDMATTQARNVVARMRDSAALQGSGAMNWEHEAYKVFIRERLVEIKKHVQPFWALDGIKTAGTNRPYGFVVLAADQRSYQEAETRWGIGGVLTETAQLMNAGTPIWLPGKDRIALYSREGVTPLSFLGQLELKKLRDAAAQKTTEKELYTDRRYSGVIDEVIRVPESPGETLRYLIALGIQFGVVTMLREGGQPTGRLSVRLADGDQTFANVIDLQQVLEDQQDARRETRKRVNTEIQKLKPGQLPSEVARAMQRASELRLRAQAEDDPAVARWWDSAGYVLNSRQNYGQYSIS